MPLLALLLSSLGKCHHVYLQFKSQCDMHPWYLDFGFFIPEKKSELPEKQLIPSYRVGKIKLYFKLVVRNAFKALKVRMLSNMSEGSFYREKYTSRGCDNQSTIKENNNAVKSHEFTMLLKIGKSYEYKEAIASIDFQHCLYKVHISTEICKYIVFYFHQSHQEKFGRQKFKERERGQDGRRVAD